MNEIRPSYLKINYLNVSAAIHLPRGIGVSQSGSTGAAPPEERFWDICRGQVSDR